MQGSSSPNRSDVQANGKEIEESLNESMGVAGSSHSPAKPLPSPSRNVSSASAASPVRKPSNSKVQALHQMPSGPTGSAVEHIPESKRRPLGSESLRNLYIAYFDAPLPSAFRVALACLAYILLVTDIFRSGPSLDSLPFEPIEPDVYNYEGPHVHEMISLQRKYTGTSSSTVSRDGSAGIPSEKYKMETNSFGLRSILALRTESLQWPECITLYDGTCPEDLSPTNVFNMLEATVETVRANDVNTTSYKNALSQLLVNSTTPPPDLASNFSIAVDRDYLSLLPQRVRFSIRSKARWVDKTSSILSNYFMDQKYWISTWGTYFDDFNASVPGMDLCLDDLDRPLFCEKTWANFGEYAPPGSDAAKVGQLWEDISKRAAALQTEYPNARIDLTIVEVETDPITLVGGAVVIAHKLYNVVAIFRVQDCSLAINANSNEPICLTIRIDDQRYSGRILYTNAVEWRFITRTMRYFAQFYMIIRLLSLMVACYRSVRATRGFEMKIWYKRVQVVTQLFFSIPCQVIVYSSCIPVFVYAAAHAIDGVILYYLDERRMSTADTFFDQSFWEMMRMIAVRMRNVWVVAFFARVFVFAQTSGGWTPTNGITGIKGYLIPFISAIAVTFVIQSTTQQDSRIVEAHEVEPTISFMNIRADVLDSWKMNVMGLSQDLISLSLTTAIYSAVLVTYELLRRLVQRTYWGRESLFLTRTEAPYAAGVLWDSSSLVVGWEDDLFTTVHKNIVRDTGSKPVEPPTFKGFYAQLSKDVETKHALMNIAFLSDPWNLLTMQFGQTRIHLYEVTPSPNQPLVQRAVKLLHPYPPARFLREYGLHEQQVRVLGLYNASELSWEQLVLCR